MLWGAPFRLACSCSFSTLLIGLLQNIASFPLVWCGTCICPWNTIWGNVLVWFQQSFAELWKYIVCGSYHVFLLFFFFLCKAVADPQRLLEEKEAAEEKLAISDYELRLAQEDILKLKSELQKKTDRLDVLNGTFYCSQYIWPLFFWDP